MRFTTAAAVEQVVWQMRLADYQRGLNRSRINDLANGAPPYTEQEERENNLQVNANDLTLTRLSHDARTQLYQAFMKPGQFFTARTDYGAQSRRARYGSVVSREMNRIMKRSLPYFECMRSKFALDVLHGIGPSVWTDRDHWCPTPLGLDEVLVPSGTRLTFDNLPFIAFFRPLTSEQLHRMTTGDHVDKGWNREAAARAVKWASETTLKAQGTTWAEYWSPEKMTERIQQDSGLFASDIVQTIDVFDFYYWDDAGGEEGWRRRMIFDAQGGFSAWAPRAGREMPSKNLIGDDRGKSDFLYSSGDTPYATRLSEILHAQFADLSAVAPFRYHSVRSLGFLLYAACHLQNRLRCRFAESVFENLLQYLRVKSGDDAERALKVELANRGIIDDSVSFVTAAERWQPNPQMVDRGMALFETVIRDNSSSYVQNQNFSQDRTEKTKFQVMAEVNALTNLTSAALNQAYTYGVFEYQEILRRFMRRNSTDPDVKEFQARVLAQRVPEGALHAGCWDIEPERVLGSGNKTMEMAIAQQLMQWRAAFTPDAQRQILRDATLAITDDPGRTDALVPYEPEVSKSAFDAATAFGSLMAGAAVTFPKSVNLLEAAETLLTELARVVLRSLQGRVTPESALVDGMENVSFHVAQLVQQVAGDEDNADRVKALAAGLNKVDGEIQGFRRQADEMGQTGVDPALAREMALTQAKVESMQKLAEAKAANMRESHGARTAQKQVQFEMKLAQDAEKHALDIQKQQTQVALDVQKADIETAASVQRERAAAAAKPAPKSTTQ